MIIGVIKRPLNICVNKLDGILVKKETLFESGSCRMSLFLLENGPAYAGLANIQQP